MADNQEPSSFQVAQAEWNACRLVHEFVNGRVRPLVEQARTGIATSDRDYFCEVLLRVLAWTHTLTKLHEPADRVRFWGGRHPRERWTGRNLEHDAAAATHLSAPA